MYRKWILPALVALPLVICSLVVVASESASETKAANVEGFVCSITGEELPCEKCCPLNAEAFVCPLNGEKLQCEKCCPLND